jgi:hypothetical protein
MTFIKKLKTIVLGVSVAALTLTSCETPETTPPAPAQATSYFTYLGNTYTLDAGSITSDSNDNFIVLHSNGISLNAAKDDFLGTGDGISFSVYGSGVLGSYTFDNTTFDPAVSGEFDDAEFIVQGNAQNNTALFEGELAGGTTTITNGTSGTYIIDITSTANGNPITVHYEGTLIIANIH